MNINGSIMNLQASTPVIMAKTHTGEFRESIHRLISNMAQAKGGVEGTKGIVWTCAGTDMKGIWEKYQTIPQRKPSLPHVINSLHPRHKIIIWSSVSASFLGALSDSCPVLLISKQMEVLYTDQKTVKLSGISGGQKMSTGRSFGVLTKQLNDTDVQQMAAKHISKCC